MKSHSSQLFCASFLILIAILTANIAAAVPISSPRGYALTPPQGWQTDRSGKTGNDLVVFTSDPADKFTPNMNVRIGRAGPHDTLESAKLFFNRTYPVMFPHWKLISQRFSPMGGGRSLDTVATCVIGSPRRRMRVRQALVIRGRTLFFFTCVSPEESHARYDKVFDGVLRSVRWKPSG